MLLPKGGVSWKAARSQLPPTRAIWAILTKTRFLLLLAVTGVVLLLWRGISSSTSELQRFDSIACFWSFAPTLGYCGLVWHADFGFMK